MSVTYDHTSRVQVKGIYIYIYINIKNDFSNDFNAVNHTGRTSKAVKRTVRLTSLKEMIDRWNDLDVP